MGARACRWCENTKVPIDERGTSYCDQCRRWDSTECFCCRTTEGFPIQEAQVTYEQALTSPVLQHDGLTEVARQAERVVRKSFIYCPRCFHGGYFVVPGPTDMSAKCLLCETVWKRTQAAEHR